VNLKFLTCILAAGFSFSSAVFAAGSNESANLRLMAFGSEAQLKAVNNAVDFPQALDRPECHGC
jgi:hypothetical protein